MPRAGSGGGHHAAAGGKRRRAPPARLVGGQVPDVDQPAYALAVQPPRDGVVKEGRGAPSQTVDHTPPLGVRTRRRRPQSNARKGSCPPHSQPLPAAAVSVQGWAEGPSRSDAQRPCADRGGRHAEAGGERRASPASPTRVGPKVGQRPIPDGRKASWRRRRRPAQCWTRALRLPTRPLWSAIGQQEVQRLPSRARAYSTHHCRSEAKSESRAQVLRVLGTDSLNRVSQVRILPGAPQSR
jgi:hypothetical protein